MIQPGGVDEVACLCSLRVPGLQTGLELFVHAAGDTHISEQLSRQGVWEPFETQLILRSLRPGSRFLDAGANIGYFSVIAAHCVGQQGRVFAFEPEPRNYAVLEANTGLHEGACAIESCRAALSDTAGQGRLYLNPGNLGDHQLFEESGGRHSIDVTLVRGCDWLDGRVERLDFVKIDVQGAEHAVVEGLMPLLRQSAAGLRMLVELTPRSLRAAGSSGAELIAALAELGLPFAIVDHIEHRLAPTTVAELTRWCNNLDACAEDSGFMNIFLGATL